MPVMHRLHQAILDYISTLAVLSLLKQQLLLSMRCVMLWVALLQAL